MAVRAWRVWGTSIVLAGGLVAVAQTPKSEVSGRATPAITQDHYQPEAAPPPRLLPQQIRDWNPSKPAPPAAVRQTTTIFGRQLPSIPTPDLDVPIRASGHAIPPLGIADPALDWKARAALDVAEMFFDACDTGEARAWYTEVIKLAPDSKYAKTASERLSRMQVIPAGGQSDEPPLADAGPREAQVRIR
jgi:hypothetical protein